MVQSSIPAPPYGAAAARIPSHIVLASLSVPFFTPAGALSVYYAARVGRLTAVGALWFGLFFLSRPLQKHCARSLDSRRPGLTLSAETLSVPTPEDNAITIRPGAPYELTYGWGEYAAKSAGGPTSNTLGVLTHATLTQGGVSLFFKAEDSAREAEAAGWPRVTFTEAEGRTQVRLWAVDLVSLVGAMRSAGAPPSWASGPVGEGKGWGCSQDGRRRGA